MDKKPKYRFIISNKVRKFREASGETQQELADAIGTSRQTIINVEKGKMPEFWLAIALALHFNTSVEKIFIATPCNS